jgi:hypothetical protein
VSVRLAEILDWKGLRQWLGVMFTSCGFLLVLVEEEEEEAFLPFVNLVKNVIFH